MEKTPQEAIQIAYQKRLQVLEHTDEALRMYSQGRERQIELSEDEKANLNILSFGIAGAVLSFSPSSIENELVLFGLSILVANAFILGILAAWHQRRLNIKNFEKASKQVREIVNPYFDAYDDFIKIEPLNEELWKKQHDAYIEYLEQQKNRGTKDHIAERSILSKGGWYYAIFAIGFLMVCGGLFQKYYLEGGDVTKVEVTKPIEVHGAELL